MYNYCTLFDSNYLTRGLAMYESLKKYSDDFNLYIFAFDSRSYSLLKKLNLKFVNIISLKEFEDEQLLRVKYDRSAVEYCWTCTPSTIKYCIEKYNLDSCTYLDADLYFFSNPSLIISEMGNKSILITEHRYTPEYDQSETNGIYCVQFMTFKNDKNGMKVLDWWRKACLEWCYARLEDGKFGDQKYLDDWTSRFDGVYVSQNIGAGVAPWNVQQYDLNKNKIIFYHFHALKFLEKDKLEFGSYRLQKDVLKILYRPYINHLLILTDKLKTIDISYDYNGITEDKLPLWRKPFSFFKRKFYGNYNRYNIKKIIG